MQGHEAWIKAVRFGENKKWVVSSDKVRLMYSGTSDTYRGIYSISVLHLVQTGTVRVWNTESGSQRYNKMVKFKDPSTVELIKVLSL